MNLNPLRWFGNAKAEALPEQRSLLENPTVPVTADQLAALISYAPTRSGVQIDERSAMTFTAVFAAVRILSESIGMLPTGMYEGDEDSQERKKATDHPAYHLLRWSPNPEMTAASFKETMQGHLTLWNDCYARIIFSRSGDPVSLWPMMPDRTHPERFAGQLRYVDTRTNDRFAPEEILHIHGLGYNGLIGYKVIELAREAIATGKAAELFVGAFFGNGANIGGVLEHPMKLKKEQKDQLAEDLNKLYSGVGNAAKTLILDGGLKYTPRGVAPEQAQLIQLREFAILEVARLWKIPPHMLGDMTKAGYASIEQMSLDFLTYTLMPWIVKWEQECTRKLAKPGSGYFAKFDERVLLRGDLAARTAYFNTAINAGWMNPNQARGEEGMNPGGPELDTYRFPVNMVDAKNADKVAAAMQSKSADTATPAPTTAKRDEAVNALRPVFVDTIGRMLRKEHNARGRNMSPDKTDQFYAEHRTHVYESLATPVKALRNLLGISGNGEEIKRFADERHEDLDDSTLVRVSESKANELIEALFAGQTHEKEATAHAN